MDGGSRVCRERLQCVSFQQIILSLDLLILNDAEGVAQLLLWDCVCLHSHKWLLKWSACIIPASPDDSWDLLTLSCWSILLNDALKSLIVAPKRRGPDVYIHYTLLHGSLLQNKERQVTHFSQSLCVCVWFVDSSTCSDYAAISQHRLAHTWPTQSLCVSSIIRVTACN